MMLPANAMAAPGSMVCVCVCELCVSPYWLNVELEVQVTEVPDLMEALL